MSLANALPVNAFPGFKHYGVVSEAVQEIVTTFNTESLDALNTMPEKNVAWADRGSRVTEGLFEVKIPIRLPSSMVFKPFDGTRSYNKLDIVAPAVRSGPFDLNFEWPMQIDSSGIAQLKEFYGAEGLARQVVQAARYHKAQLIASLIYKGFTNAALGVTAEVNTIPQPGFVNGLPLFSDGVATAQHYAHPLNPNSGRFPNLYLNAGKITDQGVFGTMLTNMSQVPHPSYPNMTMGSEVTDIVGPTHMLIPFYQTAIQNLSLQVSGSNFAATTNIYRPELLEQALQAGAFVGASGLTPWRFWIAPQLDNHPYLAANPGAHMWLAISDKPGQRWAELVGPNEQFVPVITLFGDGDPQSQRSKQVSMLGDLDAGAAAGLPHFVQKYFETTPA